MFTGRYEYALKTLQTVLLPPDRSAPVPYPWNDIETALKLKLPDEYKAFMDLYGSGGFAEFWVGNPNDWLTDPDQKNAKRLYCYELVMKQFYSQFSAAFKLWPEPRGLLCLGGDTNAGTFSWIVSDSPHWSIVYAEQDPDQMQILHMNFVDLLRSILNGNMMPPSMLGAEYWKPHELEQLRIQYKNY